MSTNHLLSDVNPSMNDVPSLFKNISKKGDRIVLKNADIPSDSESHLQGVVKRGDVYLLCHNNTTGEYNDHGYFAIVDGKSTTRFDTLDTGFNHPGGMQVIGDYLVVGIEDGKHDNFHVRLYDLSNLPFIPSMVNDFDVTKSSSAKKGAAAVGIVNYKAAEDQKNYYLLAVLGTSVNGIKPISFYRSQPNTRLVKATFTPYFTIDLPKEYAHDGGYSSIPLIADTNQDIFMIGFRSESIGSEDLPVGYKDYAELYKINLSEKKYEILSKNVHFTCNHDDVIKSLGVHFRYGVGIDYSSGKNLSIIVTERNPGSGNQLELNIFK